MTSSSRMGSWKAGCRGGRLTTVDRTWVELEEKAEVAEVAGEAEAEVEMSSPPTCLEDFPFRLWKRSVCAAS